MAQPSAVPQFQWDNSYAKQLAGFYVACAPAVAPKPVLLRFNRPLAEELGLGMLGDVEGIHGLPVPGDREDISAESPDAPDSTVAARIFSGNELPSGAQPLAQAYAGHQFGGFVPQLGDGRALLVGEVIDCHGRRRDIALKGSGPTPFSRGGDGKAAVGPVLREYLIGEAMHAQGIPTTRALAAVETGEVVRRERALPGAILTRVAASHVRVGTFQYFAARQRHDQLRVLADYVIERHDPSLQNEADRYLLLLKSVAERQASLLAQWMLAGFIHGVMNTDNMAVSGETIDYGPCAFMEAYNPRAVFSSIDAGGRYAYSNQPLIAQWNLARFAETLLPLIDASSPDRAAEAATEVIHEFLPRYEASWLSGVRRKLGLTNDAIDADSENDKLLAEDWLELLQQHAVDFTLGWRRLADAAGGRPELLESLFPSADVVRPWLERWHHRLAPQATATAAEVMRGVNPIYIPRNHLVEEALTAASDHAELELFERLLEVIERPYDERPGFEDYAQPAPSEFTDCYQTFCGT